MRYVEVQFADHRVGQGKIADSVVCLLCLCQHGGDPGAEVSHRRGPFHRSPRSVGRGGGEQAGHREAEVAVVLLPNPLLDPAASLAVIPAHRHPAIDPASSDHGLAEPELPALAPADTAQREGVVGGGAVVRPVGLGGLVDDGHLSFSTIRNQILTFV